MKKYEVNWYTPDEVICTDYVEAESAEEAEKKAKTKRAGNYPAPLCTATEV